MKERVCPRRKPLSCGKPFGTCGLAGYIALRSGLPSSWLVRSGVPVCLPQHLCNLSFAGSAVWKCNDTILVITRQPGRAGLPQMEVAPQQQSHSEGCGKDMEEDDAYLLAKSYFDMKASWSCVPLLCHKSCEAIVLHCAA